jgi:hypothetical protein
MLFALLVLFGYISQQFTTLSEIFTIDYMREKGFKNGTYIEQIEDGNTIKYRYTRIFPFKFLWIAVAAVQLYYAFTMPVWSGIMIIYMIFLVPSLVYEIILLFAPYEETFSSGSLYTTEGIEIAIIAALFFYVLGWWHFSGFFSTPFLHL